MKSEYLFLMLVEDMGCKAPVRSEELSFQTFPYVTTVLRHESEVASLWIQNDITVGLFEAPGSDLVLAVRLSRTWSASAYMRTFANSSCLLTTIAELDKIFVAG